MTSSPGHRLRALRVKCYRRRQRRRTPATVTSLAPYTMCRRASNKLGVFIPEALCYGAARNSTVPQRVAPHRTATQPV